MCRLQVFTISGAWRRLYFAIRVLPPQTSAHTRKYALICTCVCVYRYTYTSIGTPIPIYRCRGRQGKESSSSHTHKWNTASIYIHTNIHYKHARNNGRIFALCGQADSERYTHIRMPTQWESKRERDSPARSSAAVPCVRKRNQRGQLLLLLLPLAAFAGSENKNWKKMPNWLAKGEYDKKIR